MLSRPLTTALAALALTGVLGACGGGDGDDDAGPASLDENAAAEADSDGDDGGGGGGGGGGGTELPGAARGYAECMRDHGVEMPDPEVNEDGGIAIRIGPGEGGPP